MPIRMELFSHLLMFSQDTLFNAKVSLFTFFMFSFCFNFVLRVSFFHQRNAQISEPRSQVFCTEHRLLSFTTVLTRNICNAIRKRSTLSGPPFELAPFCTHFAPIRLSSPQTLRLAPQLHKNCTSPVSVPSPSPVT